MTRLLTIGRRGERTASRRGLRLEGWMSLGAGGTRLTAARSAGRFSTAELATGGRFQQIVCEATDADLDLLDDDDWPSLRTASVSGRSTPVRDRGARELIVRAVQQTMVREPVRTPGSGPRPRRHEGLAPRSVLQAGQPPGAGIEVFGRSSLPHEDDALGDTISTLRRRDPQPPMRFPPRVVNCRAVGASWIDSRHRCRHRTGMKTRPAGRRWPGSGSASTTISRSASATPSCW